jgi:hypothetical protein
MHDPFHLQNEHYQPSLKRQGLSDLLAKLRVVANSALVTAMAEEFQYGVSP